MRTRILNVGSLDSCLCEGGSNQFPRSVSRIRVTLADFAYEPCHTKRRINADELARIT